MSREAIEQDLIAAERRAAEGRYKIQCQIDTISDLTRRERDTAAAQATLAMLNEDQAVHDKEVQRLLAELRNYDAKQKLENEGSS
jgi:hypothetical protein